ncbi:MAG: rhodanese-like domain-containing protein [Planctomycetota bacterium]
MSRILLSTLVVCSIIACDGPVCAKPEALAQVANVACPACVVTVPAVATKAMTTAPPPEKEATTYADVSLADLKKAIADKKITLLDNNGSESFTAGHLPGAIDYAANKDALAKALPADKAALIVAYCGGPKCGAWKKAAEAATALGYTNVKHFAGGRSGWTEGGEKLVAEAKAK